MRGGVSKAGTMMLTLNQLCLRLAHSRAGLIAGAAGRNFTCFLEYVFLSQEAGLPFLLQDGPLYYRMKECFGALSDFLSAFRARGFFLDDLVFYLN